MPQSDQTRVRATHEDVYRRELDAFVTAAIKEQGFSATLKLLRKAERPKHKMRSVQGGILEELPSGLFDAALETDEGPLLLRNVERFDRRRSDPQLIYPISNLSYDEPIPTAPTADELLVQLAEAGANPPCSLLCEVELARFDPKTHPVLLPLLWTYIRDHRSSNDRDELVAVAAAIRKYIATMPMAQMGNLAVLLESGHRSPIPIDVEIEVAKMICRNFEIYPPLVDDPHPELAQRLWEIVQAYINPRVLLRDKHAAAASLAIEAIVSMRSSLAEQAWQAAVSCSYPWFAELVSDDLVDLIEKWVRKNPDAATWLRQLRDKVIVST